MATVYNGVVLNDQDTMIVSSGITAYDTVITAGANPYHTRQTVEEGGSAVRTEVKKGGLYVSGGGYVNSAVINGSSACMYVSANGSANGTVVKNNGELYVSAGAKVTNVNVDSTGHMEINVTKDTILTGTSHGKSVLVSNGVTSNITLHDATTMVVASNWVSYDTIISAGANPYQTRQTVEEGGSAVRTEVKKGGLYISGGGYANSAMVNGGSASMYISAAGYAGNTTVKNGGVVYVHSGGTVGGSLSIENGGSVNVSSGGIVDFALQGRTAGADYLINDISAISGSPNYTVTVSANQAEGTYRLAQGAEDFTGTVTVRNTNGTSYGTVTANGDTLRYNGIYSYRLTENDGNLQLTVTNDSIDLNISNYQVSKTTLSSAEPLTLSFTVNNNGAKTAAASVLKIYDGDRFLREVSVGSIAAGSSRNCTVTIAAGKLSAGTRQIHVVADANNTINETNETNNRAYRTVKVQQPDLRVPSFEVSKNSINTKESTKLTFKVFNDGAGLAPESMIKVYDGDKLLREIALGEIAAGGYRNCTITIPAGKLTPGSHKIYVVVDANNTLPESNENNNRAYRTINVVKRADLRVPSFEVSKNNINTKESTKLTFQVFNDGDKLAPESMIKVYDGDKLIREIALGEIDAGGYRNCTITIPAGKLSVGSHKIYVVLDANNTISEANEGNNRAYRTINVAKKADLRVPSFEMTSNSITSGESTKLTFQVFNDGDKLAPESMIKVYDGDKLLREIALGEIAAGGYRNCTITLTSGKLSVGTHKIYVVVDANGTVAESNEDNNRAYRTLFVKSGSKSSEIAAKDDNSWDVCGTGSVDALCGGNYTDLGEWSLENSAALTRSAADILTTDKEESRLLNSGKLAG